MKYRPNITPPPNGVILRMRDGVLYRWIDTGLDCHYCCHGWCKTCWSWDCGHWFHNKYACPEHYHWYRLASIGAIPYNPRGMKVEHVFYDPSPGF